MNIHLRQICLVAEKLEPSVGQLSRILGIDQCFIDPAVGKFGLENTLLGVGSQFLEVVAPITPNTAAGRFLERRGGNGGYMVICQAITRAAQDRVRQRATDNAVRVAYESDRGSWNLMQLHPADMGAAFLEVDWDCNEQADGFWHPAGGDAWRQSVRDETVWAISGVELQSSDPERLAQRWAAVLGQPVGRRNGMAQVSLANAGIRFIEAADGRGDGLGAIELRCHDAQAVQDRARQAGCVTSSGDILICGTRIILND